MREKLRVLVAEMVRGGVPLEMARREFERLYLEEVRVSNRLPVWNAIAASSAPVRYRVDLSDLGFTADTELFAPQRAFYEGFLSEGAPDCGPSPSINF